MTESLKVNVWRGTDNGKFTAYDVPRSASQTVLDVVTHIQRQIDPTLSYRFACRVGMCGSCAMSVNGVARWTCRTHVSRVAKDGVLEIAPLANLPVIKDLVTDMSEFFDKWARAKGQFKGTRTRHDDFARIAPQTPERVAADAGIECIGCGVCYASCDVVAWRPAFLGPAALNRAWTLVNDTRDTQQRERVRAVAGDAGCHACHTQGSCSERCPKRIEPTAGIAGLKRLAARAAVRGEL
jgi:fumarate reductase iron-sulfur subunit